MVPYNIPFDSYEYRLINLEDGYQTICGYTNKHSGISSRGSLGSVCFDRYLDSNDTKDLFFD